MLPTTARVLIIDDHQLTRSLLRGILKEAGFHHIREASDGEAGLQLAVHSPADLICLDLVMPGKTGLEVLKELRVATPRSLVLMVTASSERDTVMSCLSAGACGYIVKPFNASTILRVIEGAFARAKPGGAPA